MQAVQIISVILIFGVVAPLWIVFHYIYAGRDTKQGQMNEQGKDKEKIEELLSVANKMEDRINTLEAILDKQNSEWRHDS